MASESRILSAPDFFVAVILICFRHSQIFKLSHIFKGLSLIKVNCSDFDPQTNS